MLQILMAVFGIIALVKGEFKITRKRKVRGSMGRVAGVIMLVGAAAPLFIVDGLAIMFLAFIVAIVLGLATSVPIADTPAQ